MKFKPTWKTPADFIKEVALVVDQTEDAALAAGTFVSAKGCLCPLGHITFKYSGRVKKAVEGFRNLIASGALDQNLADLVELKMNDLVFEEMKTLIAELPKSLEVRQAITETQDTLFRSHGKAAVVARLHQIAKEFAA